MKVAFGKAKVNQHFETDADLDVYADGAGLTFSRRKAEPTSPFERKIAPIMRDKSQAKSTEVSQLVVRLYKNESSKLYFGFTQQHAETIQRIVASDKNIHREKSVFRKAIDSNSIPSNDDIDTYLMNIYLGGHKNDVPGHLPERNFYPPTNKDVIIAPPNLSDWKKRNNSNVFLNAGNPFGFRVGQFPGGFNNFVCDQTLSHATKRKIIGIQFKLHLIDDSISILIKRDLNNESSMLDVMKKCNVEREFDIWDIGDCKFLIKKQSGSYFNMNYDQFFDITVEELISISNIDKDYTIEIMK